MKRKSIIFIFVIIFCVTLLGCKPQEQTRKRKILSLTISASDGSSVYPYGPTPADGIYSLKEHQTYKLCFSKAAPQNLDPQGIVMEYDNTVFEIVCLTMLESPEYGEEVYYNLTCLKKCESASFIAYTLGSRNSYMYCQELVFSVE
ncbi:MAG: hypothetical protein K2J85_06755 [Anaeroplasmataceae bacterium]|nr:hypothetical protein [Anaeroplasmataceae bacterium]